MKNDTKQLIDSPIPPSPTTMAILKWNPAFYLRNNGKLCVGRYSKAQTDPHNGHKSEKKNFIFEIF